MISGWEPFLEAGNPSSGLKKQGGAVVAGRGDKQEEGASNVNESRIEAVEDSRHVEINQIQGRIKNKHTVESIDTVILSLFQPVYLNSGNVQHFEDT